MGAYICRLLFGFAKLPSKVDQNAKNLLEDLDKSTPKDPTNPRRFEQGDRLVI
jgi:hypothetical protein